jgi:amidohydrolase
MMKQWSLGLGWLLLFCSVAQAERWQTTVAEQTALHHDAVVELRHWFHQYPELSNREFNTAKRVAKELRDLGFDEVTEGVAHTGVVGILKGGKPGPVVALRADMDALPVQEKTGLPFASKATALWEGKQTGVMHACGHDAHMAILLGVAKVLVDLRAEIPGTVMFIFQPAEEGPPGDEEGGAELMLAEGLFEGPNRPGAVFGLHVFPGPTGSIMYRPDGFMAAADYLEIIVNGVQTHGSMPWSGVDPIAAAAQVVASLQTVVSRQMNISQAPAVVTLGTIEGGNRGNIIPETVRMTGNHQNLRSSDALRNPSANQRHR